MGTDIHTVWQRRNSAGGWEDIEHGYEENRHYRLFAVLAGVRNGRGFAGVVTGETVKPISVPRGYPDDFEVIGDVHPTSIFSGRDKRYREEHPEWCADDEIQGKDMGDHNHSWLLGSEILAWASTPKTAIGIGILDRDVYEAWDGKEPSSWCGGISGPNVIIINDTPQEKAAKPNWTHIRTSWEEDLNEQMKYFTDEVQRQVDLHGEIRIVFGFDS